MTTTTVRMYFGAGDKSAEADVTFDADPSVEKSIKVMRDAEYDMAQFFCQLWSVPEVEVGRCALNGVRMGRTVISGKIKADPFGGP